ncbi:MAG: RNHCP domain-containing protein [Trueperaceae bacterium]|nr:MAG: RNHCP domain-containing protein [Trueperaceae bacterium]
MKRFTGRARNETFRCVNCGAQVPPLVGGGYRNHCPHCLYSLHVDIDPGDRANPCRGVLKPFAVEYHGKKGWMIISRCERCHEVCRNKAALDDPQCPDDFDVIIALSKSRSWMRS